MNASLYEFFRLVRFHGGKTPYLSWHEEDELPITIMSPVLKLAEGPGFAFSARWALMQYHVWYNRSEFMEASDDEVKRRFRQWIDNSACPWYIREEHAAVNRGTRRARRSHAKAEPKELVEVYKWNKANGGSKKPPRLRTWLCGSAGSGKSTTLKAIV